MPHYVSVKVEERLVDDNSKTQIDLSEDEEGDEEEYEQETIYGGLEEEKDEKDDEVQFMGMGPVPSTSNKRQRTDG